MFLIESGLVELTRHQEDGGSIILQRAANHTVLAEASAYSDRYHCDAVAKTPTRLMSVQKTKFLNQIQRDEAFSNLWASHLAAEVQASRYRSEILARRRVADRLDGWLVWQGQTLPPKGQWKSIADQIGVSPEALYRELAKRQER